MMTTGSVYPKYGLVSRISLMLFRYRSAADWRMEGVMVYDGD
jgi:hypothetical protein